MLVLTRKVGEAIAIGDDIKIVVMQIKGRQVRLGIKAGPSTIVHREEIYQKICEENKLAASVNSNDLGPAAEAWRDQKSSEDLSSQVIKRRKQFEDEEE